MNLRIILFGWALGLDMAASLPAQDRVDADEIEATALIESLGGECRFDGQTQKGPIVTVWLGRCKKISPEVLEKLLALQSLQRLIVRGSNVNDEHLPVLQNFPRLVDLDLSGTAVTDAGMRHIRSCRLRILQLAETAISTHGIKEMHGLSTLNGLYLSRTRIANEGMSAFKAFPNLNTIDLSFTRIDDKAIAELRTIDLHTLLIDGVAITDMGLAALEGHNSLETLGISGTKVTDKGVSSLLRLPSLSLVTIDRTRITSAGVKRLLALPQVRVTVDERQFAEEMKPELLRGRVFVARSPPQAFWTPDLSRPIHRAIVGAGGIGWPKIAAPFGRRPLEECVTGG